MIPNMTKHVNNLQWKHLQNNIKTTFSAHVPPFFFEKLDLFYHNIQINRVDGLGKVNTMHEFSYGKNRGMEYARSANPDTTINATPN